MKNILDRFFLILFLGVGLALSSRAQTSLSPPDNPDVICWREGTKLQWKDFQAPQYPEEAGIPIDFISGACCTSQVIVLPYKDSKGKANYLVESFFLKKKSWVRDSAVIMNRVQLAHEQLHFDINELFARKIRLKITQCYVAGRKLYGPELGEEIRCLLEEENEFQDSFDHEAHTDNSARMLQKWQAIVERELTTLKAYKSTAATCGQ